MPSAQFYRDRAAQIRRLIDGIRDLEMQDQLEIIAKEYEQMAETLGEQTSADPEKD